jgi:putative transcriptional regulator
MTSLAGKLLIAMPAMPDPRFAHSVVLLCAHSAEGAMGLIVNRPLPDLTLAGLVSHLDVPSGQAHAGLGVHTDGLDMPVYFGGPVETGRGFVLHSADYFSTDGSLEVAPGTVLTTSREVLADMARGQGPAQVLTALGYAGWGANQLEGEIRAGGWLLADFNRDLIFTTPDAGKWDAALRSINVDPRLLASTPGYA